APFLLRRCPRSFSRSSRLTSPSWSSCAMPLNERNLLGSGTTGALSILKSCMWGSVAHRN
ncbi:hypothetical protein HDU91_001744, partial [Kappamyces sp. JEL0680]